MIEEKHSELADFASRIFADIRAMSVDGPGVTRQAFSAKETAAMAYLEKIGTSLGLEIEHDAAGGIWMTLPGRDRSLPAFVAGSHADSVPQGGNYDGLAGVVAALCAAKHLRDAGITPKRDYRVLVMRGEESSFFGKAYMGSLGMMGRLTPADLALKHRTTGETLADAMRSQGLDPDKLTTGQPVIDPKKIAAFVELHIEQGPTLTSQETCRTGIVTGIRCNIRHKAVKCVGETAHSGAVDKQYRHDAVMATARLLSRMEDRWQAFLDEGKDLVFTVGVLKTADTAAISVIPGLVSFTIDMRSLSIDTCNEFHAALLDEAKRIEEERGVKFEFDKMLVTQPAVVNAALSDQLVKAAAAAEVPVMRLASGAGHDSAVLGNCGIPVAMIFVANQHGSHNPHEAMKIEDFMAGTRVLCQAVEDFDRA